MEDQETVEAVRQKLASRPLAFEVLRHMTEADKALTLSEVAAWSERTLPTVYQAMSFLQHLGLVESEKQGRERRYSLGKRYSVWDFVKNPEVQRQVAKSLYRFQRPSSFTERDLVSQLALALEKSGLQVVKDTKIESPLGNVSLDIAARTTDGKQIDVELKRLRRTSETRENLLSAVGKITTVIRTQPPRILLLVLLLPHSGEAKFDEWQAKGLVKTLSTRETRVELVVKYIDDEDMLNPGLVADLAETVQEKLKAPD